jgi:hypothetical protein
VEKSGQLRCRLLLHRRQRVRVNAERHLDLGVSEPPLHDVRRDARRQHQRGHGVGQAVKLDALDARLLGRSVPKWT